MFIVNKTNIFVEWIKKLKDRKARAIILNHIDNMEEGKLGVFVSVGSGVFEKKINYGPGYRLYYVKHGGNIILLLCGGDKPTQQNDIIQAQKLWKELK
ncbi:MAG: type II toxin-antitoxin system RelE/ParE family toxin [Oscillospiraceae bacterium]|jgi:putative addiction module killer protein|nr:type II toxin-antitoxin system RelE/ParE family toxin [Oscillospiraceae bacterium]